MTIRIVFLGEGTSDSGIVPHIESIAVDHDVEVSVTDPDLGRLPKPPGRAVIVPVRMTEAWLLTSETELRQVAGNPNGRMPLDLPGVGSLESVADPKALLKQALASASGFSGRRLERFAARFSQHRSQLLERLDRTGPVSKLPSWQHFVAGVETGLKAASGAGH